eukprot:CAMPEP_0205808738 /NCGR_PEP_ID=MMETSP0205-20121125/12772_1 /ASSEMBLY_ACC=CAM_ASM_000278 /TAXON_ID=36767 /ORGANISM="Euplotes focardii, Strain TN1" /LENGTH=83 /DNA_ID=CAMNT_0053084877 /DNA_START=520 /DNA_END=768 /DNA_ORIENTATION=+
MPNVTSLRKRHYASKDMDTSSQGALNRSTVVGRNKAKFFKNISTDPNITQDEINYAYQSNIPNIKKVSPSLLKRQQEVTLAKK